ncbi:hypothetical protein Scep_021909 [Stephania cephalantha]|uniref:CCHC-type domain-containing protein n=1 Tax=Stephania cephalantha TaxID=152367 RepID=A0AAP0F6X3_9MAGN
MPSANSFGRGGRSTKKVKNRNAIEVNKKGDEGFNLSFKSTLLHNELQLDALPVSGGIEVMPGEVSRTVVDNMDSIRFSDKLKNLMMQSICYTVLVKLLGRSIGYKMLSRWLLNLWKPPGFSRMAVVLNLTKSLKSKIVVDGKLQRVDYERLPLVCYKCARYGHVVENCPLNIKDAEGSSSATPQTPVNFNGQKSSPTSTDLAGP